MRSRIVNLYLKLAKPKAELQPGLHLQGKKPNLILTLSGDDTHSSTPTSRLGCYVHYSPTSLLKPAELPNGAGLGSLAEPNLGVACVNSFILV